MKETNQSIEQAKQELAKNLRYLRESGYSMQQSLRLVSNILVGQEIRRCQGNQSKASASLGISRSGFRKILNRIESENDYRHKPIYDIEIEEIEAHE